MDKFIEELKSKNPTPGGGALIAVVGELASALAIMITKYTLKLKNDEISDTVDRLENNLKEFRKLIQEDVDSYNEICRLKKLGKINKDLLVTPFKITLNSIYTYKNILEFEADIKDWFKVDLSIVKSLLKVIAVHGVKLTEQNLEEENIEYIFSEIEKEYYISLIEDTI